MALSITRSNLVDYALRAVHSSAADDTAVTRTRDAIEQALLMIGKARKWSFLQDIAQVVSIAPYTTGTVAVTNGTTAVAGTLTVFPAAGVGQFIEFDGQNYWYEITVRTSGTDITIRTAYTDPAGGNLSGDTYRILYALYDLPLNFGWMNALWDVTGQSPLAEMNFGEDHLLHAMRAGTGDPEGYALVGKRHDPNVKQIMLYPAPAAAKVYQIAYFRKPGWFDTATPATNTWKRTATADTDYVDWPDDYMDLLKDAICAKVAKEIKPEMADAFMATYRANMAESANMERKQGRPRLIGRGQTFNQGSVWDF